MTTTNNGKNGDWRVLIAAIALVTLFASGGYVLGLHAGNADIHQTQDAILQDIRIEIDRTMGPVQRQLDRIERKVDAPQPTVGG